MTANIIDQVISDLNAKAQADNNDHINHVYADQENDERVLFIRDAAIRLRCVHIIGIPDRDCWAAAERLWAAKPENC